MTASKAWWAALAGAVVGALTGMVPLLENGLTTAEIWTIVIAAIGGSGLTGTVVYGAPANKPKVQPQPPAAAGGDPDQHSYGNGKIGPL